MKAVLEDKVVAASDDIVDCKGYQYFPDSSVRLEWLQKSPKTARDFEWPHGVQVYDVGVDGVRTAANALSDETPRPDATQDAAPCAFARS